MTVMSMNKPTSSPKKRKAAPKSVQVTEGNGFNLVTYLKGVRTEWTKVSWPSWPQITSQTLVVVVMVTIFSIGLWGIDSILRLVIGLITPTRL